MDSVYGRSRELAEGILRLIADLHGPEDIVPASLQRATGVEIAFNRDDPRIYGFGQRLDERWLCNLVSLRDHDRNGDGDGDAAPNRLLFSFDDQSGREDDWSQVAGLDYDAYAHALTGAGYVGEALCGPREAFYGMRFRRGAIVLDLTLRGENEDRPLHLCVSRILIDTSQARHGHG
ncbi:MAG: hypothetical protein E6Q88_07660 [Lysobacteraceae bacterium]|nr:MAG: hypothetical protein E6Q88_07660 [Xanthomonadaceae bacterium]